MAEAKLFVRPASGLVREMSPFVAFAFGAAMQAIGAATCFWPSSSAWLYPGSDLGLSMLIAGILSIPFGLVYVLFAISMPRSGGDYVYTSRVLGPSIGFMMSFSFAIWMIVLLGVQLPINAYYTSAVLAMWGVAFGSSTLSTWASMLVTPTWMFGFSVLGAVVALVMVIFGAKYTSTILKGMFVLGMVGQLIVMGVLLTGSHEAFVSGFDRLSSIPYSAVIGKAAESGYVNVPANLGATISSLPLAFFAFMGFNYAVYVAGEIKEVAKSMWLSVMGVLFGAIIMVGGSATLIYRLVGFDWFQALSNLYYSYPAAYPLPGPPYVYYLALMVNDNLALWVIAGASLLAWTLMMLLAQIMVPSRTIFAWAFDRIVPTKLADVSPRFRSPTKAVALIFVLAMIIAGLYVFTSIFTLFVNVTLGFALVGIIPCIAAIIYPRTGLYKESAANRFKIGNVPLISVCGGIALAFQIFLTYEAYATPGLSGPVGYPTLALIAISFIAPVLIYQASRRYHLNKDGFDIGLAFKEIPP